MGYISTLHELARGGMQDLAHKRTMPKGFDRAASRRADRMVPELLKLLPAILDGRADVLMPRPEFRRWQEMLAEAAQERQLKAMVARLVTLLENEPRPDQQTAFALGTLNEQIAGSHRLLQRLDGMVRELDEVRKVVVHCDFAGELDLADTQEALQALRRQTLAMQSRLESYQHNLEEGGPGT